MRAMAKPNALCEPIATTSLYENEASGSSTVLTLEASNAEYAELQSPADDTVHAYRETAPFIVVQLRKRRGKVEVFLDGHLSKGKKEKRGDGTALVHDLYWHNGMHEDPEARTRVLSPITIACAVEDGQRPIRNVKVGVWQSYIGIEPAVPRQLISESNLSPHRVSDTRCRVATVPYPVAYHRKPTVTILVDRKGRQKRELDRWNAVQTWIGEYVKYSAIQVNPTGSLDDVATLVALTLFGSVFTSYALYQLQGVAALAGPVALELFKQFEGFNFAIGVINTSGNAMQATAAAAAFTTGATDAAKAAAAAAAADAASKVTAAKNYELLKYAATAFTTGLRKYLTMAPDLPPVNAQFTLPEFARTIEVIAAVLSSKPPDTSDRAVLQAYVSKQSSLYGRNEAVLWDWMACATDDVLKSDDLLFEHVLGTQLHIAIDVKDAFECEAGTSRHELRCKRTDAYYLSSAASGTLDDLKRICKAIKQCQTVLGSASDSHTLLQAVKTAFENSIQNPSAAVAEFIRKTTNAGVLKGVFQSKEMTTIQKNALNVGNKYLTSLSELSTSDQKHARAALETFAKCFLEESGNGARLLRKIETALLAKGKPNSAQVTVCRRILPQRVGRSNFIYMFRSGQTLSTQHVEIVESLGSVIREFSEYHDASQSLQLAMKSGFAYLRRFASQWESRSATRVTLSCVCQRVGGLEKSVNENVDAPLCSTLAITTPVDIHFAAAVSPVMEKSLRRIRFVVKRAQQKCDPSFLEALGLKHTSEDLLACQVFGDLWADELIALHKSGEAQCSQMQILEQASRRAALRLRARGALLLELFTVLPQAESTTDDEDEIAPEVSDVAFRATLAGRDAALLIGKLLFTRDDFEVRSVMTPIVRRSAATAVRAAAAFERNVPVHLPHEPLASLFGPRSECVAAFVRAGKLVSDDVTARRAIVAAYASARLLSNDEHDEALELLEANPQTPWHDPPTQSINVMLAAMRHRMASLRMDYDPLEVVESINTLNIDDTTSELAVAEGVGYEFYVPFGFGDARPAPTLPPVPVPMFGSVPVMGVHLKAAFDSIAGVPKSSSPSTTVNIRELCVTLEPQLRCTPPLGDTSGETSSVHPNIVQVIPMTADRHIKARFSASRSRSDKLATSDNLATSSSMTDHSKDLADAHQCNRNTLEMAHEVSSIAWNAERVVQCVVAALASARGVNDIDTICIELTIPHHAEYLETWYNKRPEQTLDTARGAHKERQAETLKALLSKNRASEKLKLSKGALSLQEDPQDQQAGPGTFDKDPDAAKKYKALKEAVETAEGLAERADEAYKDAARKEEKTGAAVKEAQTANEEAKASTKRSQRLLLGSVGVGMAMLSALLLPIHVELRGLVPPNVDVDATKVAERYAECKAVRMSEACLVISQTF